MVPITIRGRFDIRAEGPRRDCQPVSWRCRKAQVRLPGC